MKLRNDYKASANSTGDRLPTFFSDESDFNVTFWNLNYGVTLGSNEEGSNGIGSLNNTEKQIVKLITENGAITPKDYDGYLGKSKHYAKFSYLEME